tara:strand:- start:1636 stop:2424 length:789 start_codon:yes stop_codon:yes gene_type:complete
MKQKRNYTRRKKQKVKRRNNKLRKHTRRNYTGRNYTGRNYTRRNYTRRNYTRRNYKTKLCIKRGGGKVDCCPYNQFDIIGLFVIKTNHKYTPHVAIVLKVVDEDINKHILLVKNMGTTDKTIDMAKSIIGNAKIRIYGDQSDKTFDNTADDDELIEHINGNKELFENRGPGTGANPVDISDAYPFPSLTFKPGKLKLGDIITFDGKYEPKKYSVWAAGFRAKFNDPGILDKANTNTINCWVYTMALYDNLLHKSNEYIPKVS